MEKSDDLCKFLCAAEVGEDDPQSLPVDCVKALGQVNEDCIEVNLIFNAFLSDLFDSEYHIDSAATRSKAMMSLWQIIFRDVVDQAVREYSGKVHSHSRQQ